MKEAKPAAFTFENLRIVEFSLKEVNESQQELSIQIEPHGKFHQNTGLYKLTVNFEASVNKEAKEPIIAATLIADFRFPDIDEDFTIPDYFYLNSIAIMFPFLRSFISSLTLQANIKPMVLPLMNLSGLQKPLKENTTVVKD